MSDADAAGGAQRGRGPTAADAAARDALPASAARAIDAAGERRPLSAARVALVGLFVLAVIAALAVGRAFFVPLTAAIVLAMVLDPLVVRLQALRVPRTLAALASIALVVLALLVAVDVLLDPLARLLDALPAMQSLLARLTRLARDVLGQPYGDWLKARFEAFAALQGGAVSGGLFAAIASASIGIATVFLLAFFLLASGERFLDTLVRVMPRIRDKVNAVRIVRTVQEELSHYFATVTLINCALGTIVGAMCWYFELPNALLWGAIVATFNFVPYVGPLASFTLLSFASAANFSTLADALVVPLLFACVTLAEGQAITPMIVGRRVALNPVVVFVGLMFWAWLWGVPGMILAVPIMLVAKIWAHRTQALAQWSEFLGPDTADGGRR